MMGNFGHFGFGGIGMIVGLVLNVVVIVGVIWLIVWAVRRLSKNTSQSGSQAVAGPSAKEIAQVRYAKGEINREEYQQILKDLG